MIFGYIFLSDAEPDSYTLQVLLILGTGSGDF